MYGFHPKSKQEAPPPPPGTLGSGVAELGAGFLRDRRKQIDKAAGYANGGLVTGPGTGTSDDIETELPQGSYVLPADTTEALGLGFGPNSRGARLAAGLPDEPEQPVQEGFGFRPKSVPVNLSNGEYVIPPEQVEGFGARFLNKVKDATHTPTTGPLTDAAQHVGGVGFLGVDTSRLFMADGGLVDDEKHRQNSFGDMAAASQDRNTTVVGGYNPPKAAVTPPAPSTPSMSEMANRYRTPSQQSTQADVRRVDNAIDRASGASPVSTPAPAPATDQGKALDGLEGVFKHSRNEYSGNPNGMGSMGTGRPSAQNDLAAESLANRYRAPAAAPSPGLGFGPGSELERREQASQNITPQTSGSGYGLLDAGVRDRRNAMMDVQQLKPGARAAYAGLVQRQEADAQRGFEGQESAFDRTFRASESAAGRTFQAGQNEADRGVQREGLSADVANNQARLGLDERRVRLEENDPALAVARQVLALRDRVLNARNPQERAQAAQDLATVEGRNQQANGGKPLPAAALRMQQDDLDAVGLASTISADLGAIQQQITDGTLKFGVIRNAWNKSKNAIGLSDEESRAFGSFMSTLEKMRNDSLRLNKGVQTEGDAQRAWNEMFQNLGDENFVKQRLAEIQAINERAASLRGNSIQTLRENYGASPLDLSAFTNVRPAVGQQAAQAQPAQQTQAQQPISVVSAEQWASLPVGTEYLAPDGKLMRKK